MTRDARRGPPALPDPADRAAARAAGPDRLVVPARTEPAHRPINRRRGSALYEANCSTCHGLEGKAPRTAPACRTRARRRSTSCSAPADAAGQPGRPARARRAEVHPRRRSRRSWPTSRRSRPAESRSRPSTPAAGDLARGAEVFLNTCAGCHGAGATGDSVGGGQIAPTLDEADPDADRRGDPRRARGDAQVRTGDDRPGRRWIRSRPTCCGSAINGEDGGLQLGRVGAVAEGLVVVVVGLGLLILFLRLTGAKT